MDIRANYTATSSGISWRRQYGNIRQPTLVLLINLLGENGYLKRAGVSVKMHCRLAVRYSSIWFSSIDYLGRRRPLSSSFCSNHKHRHFLSLLDYFTISAYCDRVGTLTLLTWRHGLAVLSNAFRDLAELFVDSQCFRTKYRAVKKIINE